MITRLLPVFACVAVVFASAVALAGNEAPRVKLRKQVERRTPRLFQSREVIVTEEPIGTDVVEAAKVVEAQAPAAPARDRILDCRNGQCRIVPRLQELKTTRTVTSRTERTRGRLLSFLRRRR